MKPKKPKKFITTDHDGIIHVNIGSQEDFDQLAKELGTDPNELMERILKMIHIPSEKLH